MDPHSMGMQGGMSMPMSIGMGGNNPQAMGMGMNPAMYGQPQQMMMNTMGQQQMAMGSMPMTQMNPNVMNPAQVSTGMQVTGAPSADWRIQLTREHRANLIAKIYNEMVRVSADPVPGIKLWMNVSWYELSLYKESPTQEIYINKIFTRLKSLRAQQSDTNAAMAAQGLPNQGMLSRLDFSYYNTLNLNQRGNNGGQVSSYPGHNQFNGSAPQQQHQSKPMSASNTPVKTETNVTENTVAEYWQQHAALRAKHQGDVEKVHNAFKKYVDHMKGHDETEQKKKLRYLLSYVELCANILNEDKATHPPRKIEELDKVFKYIVKIVNPYLKKLRTETDKRSYPSGDTIPNVGPSGQSRASASPDVPTSSGATSSGSSTIPTSTSNDFSSAMTQSQPAGQTQQQNAVSTSTQMTAQQRQQQQYMMQQRSQQMQQQQHQMQAQARQQQMMQQQQMMRQQQMQQQKGPQQQSQLLAQQPNQIPQQQNSQNAANQQSGQQTQQQMGQQGPPRPQQPDLTQQQKPSQPQQTQQAQPQQQQQNQQPPTSRGESSSISSGLSLGLDDSLYGGMSNDLLQMPTPSGTSSGGLMDFSTALSPTSFGGMDLLDWDDGTGQGTVGPGNTGTGGDGSDLMSFVETL